jgi:UDP-3-O-[3-hydroxymyristoyl] N-acetylglucosamine deacetylase
MNIQPNIKQRTIANEISFYGKTAMSNQRVHVKLQPAKANSGIKFIRSDVKENNVIHASINNLYKLPLNTTISNGNVHVHIAEHLLSALSDKCIFNINIILDGPEIPLLNGAADMFLFTLKVAGIKELNAKQDIIKIKKELIVSDGDKYISIKPNENNSLSVKYRLMYPNIKMLQQDEYTFDSNLNDFEREISFSRTFSTANEHEERLSVAPGWSYHHAVIYDENGTFVSCDNRLRINNEASRHKILDVIGDLMLAQYPIIGKIECHKSGHNLNQQLINKIFSDKDNYDII